MRAHVLIALVAVAVAGMAATAAAELTVAEIAIGSGYDRETRSLTGEAEAFAADTPRVWCRTRITGAATPTTIAHVWYHRDQTVARVELEVGSPDWRTVSSKALLPAWTGPWEVRVLDTAGNLLATVQFTVE
jgi:hypothetical protein